MKVRKNMKWIIGLKMFKNTTAYHKLSLIRCVRCSSKASNRCIFHINLDALLAIKSWLLVSCAPIFLALTFSIRNALETTWKWTNGVQLAKKWSIPDSPIILWLLHSHYLNDFGLIVWTFIILYIMSN
jgi:hypothetical protein